MGASAFRTVVALPIGVASTLIVFTANTWVDFGKGTRIDFLQNIETKKISATFDGPGVCAGTCWGEKGSLTVSTARVGTEGGGGGREGGEQDNFERHVFLGNELALIFDETALIGSSSVLSETPLNQNFDQKAITMLMSTSLHR
jgi:hypothetical protein